MKVVSIVGMAGSGKSEVAKLFEMDGYRKVRFGDITDEEVKRRGLKLNEENERLVREQLRKEHGMHAYAKLNVLRIDEILTLASVVVDGLYSWEEYMYLKERYGNVFIVIAVWASPETRYKRLGEREHRPLTVAEAVSRDRAEIEISNKGGPIAMADFTIINESSIDNLKTETGKVLLAVR
jgi:dephospho-CoA kinase